MSNVDYDVKMMVRKYREKRGLTRKELAKKVGCTEDYIKKMENINRQPKLLLFAKLCDVLNVSKDKLAITVKTYRVKTRKELQKKVDKVRLKKLNKKKSM